MRENTDKPKSFQIPLRILTQAVEDGLTIEELQLMVRLSARITHERGNRRYKDYLFQVEGSKVLSMVTPSDLAAEAEEEDYVLYQCPTCKDTRKVPVFDECIRCHGEGCGRCDEGLVPNTIPCQDCTKPKTAFKKR